MRITENHPTPKSDKKAINRAAHKVYVGIGSNIDREKNITAALTALKNHFGELQISQVYESEPMGIDHAENYYNLVVGFETQLSPEKVNDRLKAIENESGRREKCICSLDLDLLLYGDLISHENGLDIPRSDIIDYAYVAVPLSEIYGDAIHPETGLTLTEHSQSDSLVKQKLWLADFQLSRDT